MPAWISLIGIVGWAVCAVKLVERDRLKVSRERTTFLM